MALPASGSLGIKDVATNARSIAQEVDGNVTGTKTLETLGDTAFGAGAHSMLDFYGYSNAKTVCYTRYASGGACGSSGPVYVCSCLANSPAMVLGDRYDASIQWLLKIDTGSIQSQMCITCNGALLTQCARSIVGTTSGTYIVQDVDYNDIIRMKVCATAFGPSSVGCACTCLSALSDFVQSSFVTGTPKDQFVVAVG